MRTTEGPGDGWVRLADARCPGDDDPLPCPEAICMTMAQADWFMRKLAHEINSVTWPMMLRMHADLEAHHAAEKDELRCLNAAQAERITELQRQLKERA